MRRPTACSGRPQVLDREVAGDHRDGRMQADLAPREIASGDERRSDRAEVPGQHELEPTDGRHLALAVGAVLGEDRVVRGIAVHRHAGGHGDRGHAGHRLQALPHRLLHAHDAIRVWRRPLRDVDAEGLYVRGVDEPGVDVRQCDERPSHQPGADEQHEREGDLHDDQRATDAVLPAALTQRPSGVAEAGARTGARVFQDRRQAEQQARGDRDDEGEEHDGRIQADIAQARDPGGRHRHERPQRGPAEAQSRRAARRSDQETLEQHLAGQARASGAERRAERQLAAPCLEMHQPEVRHVRARDEQHDPDAAHQHAQRAAGIADHVVLQQMKARSDAGVLEELQREAFGRRERAQHDRQHPGHVGIGLGQRDARLETSQPLVAELAQVSVGAVQPERQDDGRIGEIQKPELARENADDPPADTVDPDRAPDGRGLAAEPSLPIGVADHRRGGTGRDVVGARELTPRRRRDAENRQHAVGDRDRGHVLGLAGSRDADVLRSIQADVLEASALLAIDEVVRRRHVHPVEVHARRDVPEADELFRIWIGERLQEDAIEHAEDGGVRAHRHDQGQQRHEREPRRACQPPRRLGQSIAGLRHLTACEP